MSTKSEFLQHFPDFTWNFTPEVIEKRSMVLIGDIMERINKLTSLSDDKINFQSVCESIADMETEIQRERSIIEVYFKASPVHHVRNKCFELIKTWFDFFSKLVMSRDIYDLLTKVESIEKSLPYESARYLEKSLLYKKRDGLHLGEDDRKKLTALLTKISSLCIDFSKNIANEDTKIEFEKLDLFGMPEDFFKGLDEKDGKYTVNLKYPHIIPILKHCRIIKTRQIMEKAYNSRCIDENVKILEEVLELRNERVKILGYKTHADYVTEMLISKSAANVHDFLTNLFRKIKKALKREMNRLLDLKKSECQEIWVPFDGKINMYDFIYYQNMVEELDYPINKNLIREYFPFEHVTAQLFDIYQTLLGLQFDQVADPPVIHPEVLLYAVYAKATDSLIGYFYMDLFSRPLKHSNAICFSIQSACHYKNKPQLGCAVIMASFSKPCSEKQYLLTHEELRTYFHEFGHLMHLICSKTRYSMFQ